MEIDGAAVRNDHKSFQMCLKFWQHCYTLPRVLVRVHSLEIAPFMSCTCLQVDLLYAGMAQNLGRRLQRPERKLRRLKRSFSEQRVAFDGTLERIPALFAKLRETAATLLRVYTARTGEKVTEDRTRSRS